MNNLLKMVCCAFIVTSSAMPVKPGQKQKATAVMRAVQTVHKNNRLPDAECCDCASTPIYQADFIFSSEDAINLLQTGFLLLTEAGIYCLAEDVTGSIIIQGSSITIDLNGHIIYGFSSNDGIVISNPGGDALTDIRIINGLLNGPSETLGFAGNGISINGSSGVVQEVSLEDLVLTEWNDGISVFAANNLHITRVASTANLNNGLFIDDETTPISFHAEVRESEFINNLNHGAAIGISGGLFNDCAFNNNTNSGLIAINSDSVDFYNCQSQNNANGYGFFVDNGQSLKFSNCTSNLTPQGAGFYITGANDVYLFECTVHNSSVGFVVDGSCLNILFKECMASDNSNAGFDLGGFSQPITCLRCCAESNGAGFLMQGTICVAITDSIGNFNGNDGFQGTEFFGAVTLSNCIASSNGRDGFAIDTIISSSNAIVRACTSQNNVTGFNWDGSGNASYYSNVACYNTTDYATTIGNVTDPACAMAYQNVACDVSC